MLKKDIVKTAFLYASKAITLDSAERFEGADQFVPQEDIAIIGGLITVEFHPGTSPALQEGVAYVRGILSKNGKLDHDGEFLRSVAISHYWTEIVVAQQCAGWMGDRQGQDAVMFPKDDYLELDDGEVIYLHVEGECFLLASGAPTAKVWAYLYYKER